MDLRWSDEWDKFYPIRLFVTKVLDGTRRAMFPANLISFLLSVVSMKQNSNMWLLLAGAGEGATKSAALNERMDRIEWN